MFYVNLVSIRTGAKCSSIYLPSPNKATSVHNLEVSSYYFELIKM